MVLGICVCLCVGQAVTARRISLGGEGNALYPVLSSLFLYLFTYLLTFLFIHYMDAARKSCGTEEFSSPFNITVDEWLLVNSVQELQA